MAGNDLRFDDDAAPGIEARRNVLPHLVEKRGVDVIVRITRILVQYFAPFLGRGG